jgi:hypothetical protein
MNLSIVFTHIGSDTSGTVTFNVYDPSAIGGTPIATQTIAVPSGQVTVQFLNLDNQAYVIQTIRNGLLIDQFSAQGGTSNNSIIRDTLYVTKGVDSGFDSGGTIYNDTSLIGWVYSVFQIGVGLLRPTTDYSILSTGGIQLVNGYVLQDGDGLGFIFQPQTIASSSGGGGSTTSALLKFKDLRILTADTTLTADDIGKTIIIQGSSGATPRITLPDPTTVIDNVLTCIQSNGGSHIMAALIATTQFVWLGVSSSILYLAQSEELFIYKNGTTWYVAHSDGNFKTVGRIEESFDGPSLNTLLLDGGFYSKSLYPRLYNYIMTKLNSNLITTEADWAFKNASTLIYQNIGKFTIDNSLNFRVPLIMEVWDSSGNMVCGGFTRAMGSPNAPLGIPLTGNTSYGRIQYDRIGKFFADIRGKLVNIQTNSGINITVLDSVGGVISTPTVTNVPFIGKRQTSSNNYSVNSDTVPGHIGIFKTIRY